MLGAELVLVLIVEWVLRSECRAYGGALLVVRLLFPSCRCTVIGAVLLWFLLTREAGFCAGFTHLTGMVSVAQNRPATLYIFRGDLFSIRVHLAFTQPLLCVGLDEVMRLLSGPCVVVSFLFWSCSRYLLECS
jgi:hypothetical protein